MEPTKRTLVIDNIGSLITNDPALGRGSLGIIENASLVIQDGIVESVGPAGAIADECINADGACVLPGFVDSHTHLVFAGDRSEEFVARMAGQPYDGGGIRVTTDATRKAPTSRLNELVRLRLFEAHRAGTTTIEIKSGYGLNVADEARSVEIANSFTPHEKHSARARLRRASSARSTSSSRIRPIASDTVLTSSASTITPASLTTSGNELRFGEVFGARVQTL